VNRYQDSLESLPPSGGGGCHGALLGVANRGIRAGLDPQQIFDDLRRHVHGSRRVPDREIKAAIKRAMVDVDKNQVINYDFKNRKHIEPEPVFDGPKILRKLIKIGEGATEADIWDASPVKIDRPPEEDPQVLLANLYKPDDKLFIGERYSPGKLRQNIRSAAEWQQYFAEGGKTYPHFIPNPLSGQETTTQSGKPSLRADACVKSFRFAVVEFDGLNREDQLAFWWAVNLPVACLIDSANKSIHGLVAVNAKDAVTWTREVENVLFKKLLQPLGVDGACRNEARLSRLPGHLRDSKKIQRLLYLAPGGRRVSG